ncbi:hypothetical protein [Pseudoalteromonas xiamenensis]
MQEKTIADTVNLTLDFNDVEEGQFADMMERIRAERRALLRATQEKYAKSRAQKAILEQQRQRMRLQLQCLYGAVLAIMITLCWVFYDSSGSAHRVDKTDGTHHASERFSAHQFNEAQLSEIERYFMAKFFVGDWRFRGAAIEDNGISVFIETPQPLALEPHYQREYIRSSLCPKADSDIWLYIKPEDLNIHLYSENLSRGLSAYCAS